MNSPTSRKRTVFPTTTCRTRAIVDGELDAERMANCTQCCPCLRGDCVYAEVPMTIIKDRGSLNIIVLGHTLALIGFPLC